MSYLKQTTRMGTWKARKMVKGTRASRESGKKKGLVPPAWAKYCARSGRSYKTNFIPVGMKFVMVTKSNGLRHK